MIYTLSLLKNHVGQVSNLTGFTSDDQTVRLKT